MSLTWIPALTAKVVGALDKRRLPRTIGATAALLVLISIAIVSVFGNSEDGEPKQVMKIERVAATGVGGPILDAPVSTALIADDATPLVGDPALLEISAAGPLPRVGADGRKPMNVYSRAYVPAAETGAGPKIAVVVGGLGLGNALLEATLKRLPADVSLAFTPYGMTLNKDVAAARAKGHEVLLEIPMEPEDYPSVNPGIHTLTVGAPEKNTKRLKWLMSRVTGYAGLINTHGDAFLAAQDDTAFVMGETALRGLLFVEAGPAKESVARQAARAAHVPFARAEIVIDKNPTREAVDNELAALEAAAQQHGIAIGVTGALPVTIDRLATWLETLKDKGISLVPVSALAQVEVAAPQVASARTPQRPAAKPRPRVQVHAAQPQRRRAVATRPSTARYTTERNKPRRSTPPPKQTLPSETETSSAPHP